MNEHPIPKNHDNFGNILFKNTVVERVETFKYLGVLFDSNLNFNEQMNKNLKNVNHKLYLLTKIRKNLDDRTMLNLCKTMVLPYLEFVNTILLGCPVKLKKKAQRVQNKSLRLALRSNRYYDTEFLHKEARMDAWETRAMLALNRLMFKYKNETGYLNDCNRRTRLSEGTVSFLSRKYWNDLPAYLRSVADYECFKVLLRGHFRAQRDS